MSAHRNAEIHAEGTRTLEFFIDRPTEPTFSQERKNLHAMEVRFVFYLKKESHISSVVQLLL